MKYEDKKEYEFTKEEIIRYEKSIKEQIIILNKSNLKDWEKDQIANHLEFINYLYMR